jgi:hypothetical protein
MYWIYVNKAQATLHKAGYVDCNDGLGKRTSGRPTGQWHGPFESLGDAKVSGVPMKPCRRCHPYRDW